MYFPFKKLSLSSDDDIGNNDDDSDTDFIPVKRSAPSKTKLSSFEKKVDSDSENSEVERTKALIKKLTPVKQTTISASFEKKKSGENDGKQAKMQKAGRKRKPLYRITDDESDEDNNEPSSKKVCHSSTSNIYARGHSKCTYTQ